MRYGRELEERMSSNELILGILRMQGLSPSMHYCYDHVDKGNLIQTHYQLREALELRNQSNDSNSSFSDVVWLIFLPFTLTYKFLRFMFSSKENFFICVVAFVIAFFMSSRDSKTEKQEIKQEVKIEKSIKKPIKQKTTKKAPEYTQEEIDFIKGE